jgi:AraC-like DNA-binding protein
MSLNGERSPYIFMIFLDDHVAVGMPVSGSCALTQDGREAMLTPGDFAVVDTSRPYEMSFDGIHRMLVTTAPRGLVRIRPEDLRSVTARRVSYKPVLSAVAWRQMESDGHVVSLQLLDPVLNQVATTLAEWMSKLFGLQPDGHRTDLLKQIHGYIERNLGDPELSPQSIAAMHHISLRYLQKLFQSEGETVNGWIRDRRLDRCKRDLVDPRLGNRSIAAIAARWNLSPASYFSRVFRTRYGLTPSEVRTNQGSPDTLLDRQITAVGAGRSYGATRRG